MLQTDATSIDMVDMYNYIILPMVVDTLRVPPIYWLKIEIKDRKNKLIVSMRIIQYKYVVHLTIHSTFL